MSRQAKRAKNKGLPVLETDYWRPQKRSDCEHVPRPCPFVSCRYNLFLDVCPNGSLRLPYGEDPDSVLSRENSCALDLAAEGERTLHDVGKHQALTRERVRQIESSAVAKVKRTLHSPGVDDDEEVERDLKLLFTDQ